MPSSLPLDPVLELVLDLPSRRPGPGAHRRLAGLFRELARSDSGERADEIETLIWALWVSHDDRGAEEALGVAIEAMAAGELDRARPLLDRLVQEHPDWPEAWNKRATLAYIENRDMDSLQDLQRTLELEPRHFGAILGFGQICLRNGHLNEARAAFQIALSFNPHLDDLRGIVRDLGPEILMLH